MLELYQLTWVTTETSYHVKFSGCWPVALCWSFISQKPMLRLLAMSFHQGQSSRSQKPECWDHYRVGIASWFSIYHVGDASQVEEECRHLQAERTDVAGTSGWIRATCPNRSRRLCLMILRMSFNPYAFVKVAVATTISFHVMHISVFRCAMLQFNTYDKLITTKLVTLELH